MGLILIFVAAAILTYLSWVVWGLRQGFQVFLGRLIIAMVILGLLFWSFFGRSILGTRAFFQLCEKEAGYTVYRSVKLPAKYFDKYGNPDFQAMKHPSAWAEIGGKYVWVDNSHDLSKDYSVTKDTITIRNDENAEILGTLITFHFGGITLFSNSSSITGRECPQTASTSEHPRLRSFLQQIFIKTN